MKSRTRTGIGSDKDSKKQLVRKIEDDGDKEQARMERDDIGVATRASPSQQ